AENIFAFAETKLPPYAKIRRLEFAELPKTISGKIRRVELRKKEADFHGADGERTEQSLAARTTNGGYDHEYSATDFRSEEHTSELQSRFDLVCRLLLEKKKPT